MYFCRICSATGRLGGHWTHIQYFGTASAQPTPEMSKRSEQHRKTVHQLSSLYEPSQAARPVFLLGAGASYRSGAALADAAAQRIAREVYAKRDLGTNSTARVMPGDVDRFLSEQLWFVPVYYAQSRITTR